MYFKRTVHTICIAVMTLETVLNYINLIPTFRLAGFFQQKFFCRWLRRRRRCLFHGQALLVLFPPLLKTKLSLVLLRFLRFLVHLIHSFVKYDSSIKNSYIHSYHISIITSHNAESAGFCSQYNFTHRIEYKYYLMPK